MSARLNTLMEERKKVWDRMQELRTQASETETGEFTAEQRNNWNEAESRLATLTTDIESEQRGDSMQREMETAIPQLSSPVEPRSATGTVEPANGKEERTKKYEEAFRSFIRNGSSDMTADQRQLLRENYVADDGETRALSAGGTTAGGYTVPPGFRDVLIETMKWYGSVRAVATVLQTDSGQPLQWPTFNGTSQVGRILAENTQLSQTDPAFGTATLGAYMYVSDLVLVPLQFLQDTSIDTSSFLARILGTRIGRIQNTHFTVGTGSSQPLGIDTSPTAGVTLATGNTTTIPYAGLISLIHSLDPAYRYAGNAKFMLADSALAAIRQLVDTQGHPLWQPSLQAGVADSLLGYGYVVNNDMPAPAANAKSVLFGDFERGYVIRDILGISVRRLDERYADYLQVGWFGYCRTDATVQDSAAYKALVPVRDLIQKENDIMAEAKQETKVQGDPSEAHVDRVLGVSRHPDGSPAQTPGFKSVDPEMTAKISEAQLREQAASAVDYAHRSAKAAEGDEDADQRMDAETKALKDAQEKASDAAAKKVEKLDK